MTKRALDIIGVFLLAPFALPICMLASIAIVLDSKGAPLFLQTRVGRKQRNFTCLKLRTMSKEAPNATSHSIGTSFVTRVGHFLRRTKIDELPQLWNVLCGEMSFVGPRPGLPNDEALIEARQKLDVFRAVPGITGLAQVQGVDMSDPVRLASIDAHYIETQTLKGDFDLLLRTARGGGQGDAAVR